MHPCPCGRVMGCPIAMGRNMSADASSHSFVCDRLPESGCNGDFAIVCGGTGGTFGIVHSDVLCLSVHVCASATYQCGIGEVHGMEMHASSLVGWGSPENVLFSLLGPTRLAGPPKQQNSKHPIWLGER